MSRSVVGVSDAAVQHRQHRRPVVRDRLEEREEVRRAHDVDGAPEDLGREGRSDERGIAAVRPAEDADALAVDPSLVDHVRHRVEQVVVHRAGPLLVARVEEGLAIAGRAAVVDLHADVAAVREPLREIAVAPGVAHPRPAVHEEHRRQVRARHVDREGDVAVHRQAVPGGERERLHRRERVTVESCVVNEQEVGVAGRPVVDGVAHGAVARRDRHDPTPVAPLGAVDLELAVPEPLQSLDVARDLVVEDDDLLARLGEDDGLRLACLRMTSTPDTSYSESSATTVRSPVASSSHSRRAALASTEVAMRSRLPSREKPYGAVLSASSGPTVRNGSHPSSPTRRW
jgi:hypothetical protein